MEHTAFERGEIVFGSDTTREQAASCERANDCTQILIVGVGNELLSDDGVGVHAVRALQVEAIPGVNAIEVGTAVLHGLDFLDGADRVLVIDAAFGGQAPGTVYLYDAPQSEAPQPVTSVHAMGLREAANVLLAGWRLPSFTFLGIEPQTLDYGMSLSAPLQAALPLVLNAARQVVRQWQSDAVQKPGAGEPSVSIQVESKL